MIETECPKLKWGCEITVGVVKERSVEWMRRSGCVRVNIGIESGNNRILRSVRRGTPSRRRIPRWTSAGGRVSKSAPSSLVGFPWETEETLRDTLTAIEKINAGQHHAEHFHPLSGSELFQVCKELGVVDDDFDITIYNHQSPENCFTAFIPPERFKELVREAVSVVGRKNSRGRWRRAVMMLLHRDFYRTRHMARQFLLTRAAWYSARVFRRLRLRASA